MAKDKLTEYSATNASNDVIGDISVAEGMLPSAVNNALREQMTHLKNFSDGTDGIDVLSLVDDDASASIKIQAPSAVTTTTTLTLPDGDGDAGAMLQTNGSGQLAWSTAYRNRNLIINGAMQVAQRGTSTTGIGNGGFITDRFFYDRSGLGITAVFDGSQASDVPSGFQYSAKLDCTTAQTLGASGGTYIGIRHKIEGYNVSHLTQSSFTLSFYVKSTKTGTFSVVLKNSGADRFYCAEYTVSASDTWERKDIQVDAVPSAGTWNFANGVGLDIFWCIAVAGDVDTSTLDAWTSGTMPFGSSNNVEGADSASNNFLITGVQLEVGEQATPFEHRSFGDELAACQRFTYVYNSQKIGGEKSLCNLAKWSNGTAYGSFSFPMEMRTAPSATIYNKTEFYVYIAGSVGQVSGSDTFGVANQTTDIGEVYIECGEGSSGQAGFMRKAGSASGTSSGYIVLDAEL